MQISWKKYLNESWFILSKTQSSIKLIFDIAFPQEIFQKLWNKLAALSVGR